MTISFKVSEKTKREMIDYFLDKKRIKTPPYAIFQADEADTVVTLYESGKVVFQGVSADIDANIWKQREKKLNPNADLKEKNSENKSKDKKEIIIDPKIYNATCIGSDEVGTGDYFGPIVVTASYVKKEDIKFLEELGVKDSKKMSDDKIMEVVPKFKDKIVYESIVLTNKEYNSRYSDDLNMNKIKAVLHNKVLTKLASNYRDYDYIIIDEFAKPYVYYNYLKEIPKVQRNITFLTKGESKSLAVACSSLLSRYIFINYFDKLGETLDMFLPKGSSDIVDKVGAEIVRKYGFDRLNEVAKLNFKNTDKIKKIVNNS